MPNVRAIHLNPKNTSGYSRCGMKLSEVKWVLDTNDVTCNSCLRLLAKDKTIW